ncbi:hypothetical protein MTO96_020628 [Rhipicephalus appendiculatus]
MIASSTVMARPEVVGERTRWSIDRRSVVSFRCGRFYELLEISMNKQKLRPSSRIKSMDVLSLATLVSPEVRGGQRWTTRSVPLYRAQRFSPRPKP